MRLNDHHSVSIDLSEVADLVNSGHSALELMIEGHRLVDQGRVAEALTHLEASLSLDDRAEVWINAGKTLADAEYLHEAVYCYDEALARAPAFVSAWKTRAPPWEGWAT